MSSIRINANAAVIKDDKILVIEFKDENGIHYNLPGGGVDVGESIEKAVQRECLEEACAEVTVGRLLLVWEYVPSLHGFKYGPRQKIGHIFECHLKEGCKPCMPKKPDAQQIGVKWISLSEITSSQSSPQHPLFPTIGEELMESLRHPSLPVQVISRA